jgi:hypothetical protein
MRRVLGLSVALICFSVNSAFSDLKVDGPTWRLVPKFDPPTLSKTLGDQVGRLIRVQFTFRGKDTYHMKPNWYAGSLWQRDATAREGFSNIRVVVAKKDLPAFSSITSNSRSAVPLTVYGRVERDADSNFYFVRILGRKATLDAAGNATVTW